AKERGRAREGRKPSRQRWLSSLSNDTMLEAAHFGKLLSFVFWAQKQLLSSKIQRYIKSLCIALRTLRKFEGNRDQLKPQVPTPLELLPPSLACARFALNSACGSGFALLAVTVRPPPVASAAQWLHCFFSDKVKFKLRFAEIRKKSSSVCLMRTAPFVMSL
ncbi:MAG: hypothetical protein IJY93_01985, partial [Clostridia bacterium]|nr:hypothetical protein [Clostridia bacterium]